MAVAHLPFSENSAAIEELVAFVLRHPRLLVLTGAGCSTDSGLPAYRDSNGEWMVSKPLTFQEFVASAECRKRYWVRSMAGWPVMAEAAPNPTHQALARLETLGLIHQLVTQNVDGLHQKAGSCRVIDLHGRLDAVKCLSCSHLWPRPKLQRELCRLNPDFRSERRTIAPDGDSILTKVDLNDFELVDCPCCGGILKPNVVFFGESIALSRRNRAMNKLNSADALLVIGSSLKVFSGFRFCRAASAQNKPIALVNLGHTRADSLANIKISAPCSDVIPKLADLLPIEL